MPNVKDEPRPRLARQCVSSGRDAGVVGSSAWLGDSSVRLCNGTSIKTKNDALTTHMLNTDSVRGLAYIASSSNAVRHHSERFAVEAKLKPLLIVRSAQLRIR